MVLRHRAGALAALLVDAGDGDDLRLQKQLLLFLAVMTSVAGIVWGGIYFLFGEPGPAAIPFGYAVLTSVNLAVYLSGRRQGRRFDLFRLGQLCLNLLLPVFLMLTLGGFDNSSAVILWSLTCPLGAMLLSGRRPARSWFMVYLALLILSALLLPWQRQENNLPDLVVILFYVLNIGGVSLIAFLLLNYFVGQKNELLRLLRQEQDKSERLLLNVLPRDVVAVLKEKSGAIAERYDSASILFADVVGFTPLSAELDAEQMVALLNDVFSYFDGLVEKYDLEKIRTIGDNYMVAAGVPRPRPDHAAVLACLALEMLRYEPSNGLAAGRPLEFRIGINSGPVIAGIIGHKKFQYDVWGDAVNVASRMESQGVPGKVQITQATWELLREDLRCEPRGMSEVKGKGPLETWFVEDIRESRRERYEAFRRSGAAKQRAAPGKLID